MSSRATSPFTFVAELLIVVNENFRRGKKGGGDKRWQKLELRQGERDGGKVRNRTKRTG